jgi:hypothetical protein
MVHFATLSIPQTEFMAKYLSIDSISCDLIEVLSWNLLRGIDENYDLLRIASIPAHNQNW